MRTPATIVFGILLTAAMLAGCKRSEERTREIAQATTAETAAAPRNGAAQVRGDGAAAEALRLAGDRNKHVFILFFSEDDEPTRVARESLDRAVRNMGRAAEWTAVDVNGAGEAAFVSKYNLRSNSMPVVLAFAPNGALMGGFLRADVTEEKLRAAITSRGMQECVKALQDKRLVIVCCQGKETKFNKEAMKGVEDFKTDARYASYTTVVKVDPADAEEKLLLGRLNIDPKTKEAVTVLLAPPNVVLGAANGATSKASLVKMLASASSGCGPSGCGPSGCGPSGK